MDGWKITRVLHGAKTEDGEFAAIVEAQNSQKALVLGPEQLDELSRLLQAAVAQRQGRVLSFEIPKSLEDRDCEVASVSTDVAWPGTFVCRLQAPDGTAVNLTMPHETAVAWRDSLTREIAEFVKTAN